SVVFASYALFNDADYAVEVSYRCSGPGQLTLAVWKNGTLQHHSDLPTARPDWTTQRVPVQPSGQEVQPCQETAEPNALSAAPQMDAKHWPGEGSLRIITVHLLDALEQPCTVFEVNSCFILRMEFQAVRADTYRLLPVAVIYRVDGTN